MRRAYDYWQNQPGCFPNETQQRESKPTKQQRNKSCARHISSPHHAFARSRKLQNSCTQQNNACTTILPFRDAFCGFTHYEIPSTTPLDSIQYAWNKGRRPRNSLLRPIRTCTGLRPTRRLKYALKHTNSASARDPPGKARHFAHHPRKTQQDSAHCFHRDGTKLRRTNVL